jgi:DNA-binding IclR family transcriptional regulator
VSAGAQEIENLVFKFRRVTESVPALERAVLILEFLGKSRTGQTISQLARNLALPKSSVHRTVLTLERCGFLYLDRETGRYRLGLHLFGLANMALEGLNLREQAAPFLHKLMEKTGLTVHMAVLEHDEAVLIEKVQPLGALKVATWVGKHVDLHCTALGKALLAYRSEAEIDDLIKKHGLLRHNENTIGSARKLKENLVLVRKLGYALDDEEEELGIRCMGAPIFDSQGQVAAAASVSGTTSQMEPEQLGAISEQVKRTARAISYQLGWPADASPD